MPKKFIVDKPKMVVEKAKIVDAAASFVMKGPAEPAGEGEPEPDLYCLHDYGGKNPSLGCSNPLVVASLVSNKIYKSAVRLHPNIIRLDRKRPPVVSPPIDHVAGKKLIKEFETTFDMQFADLFDPKSESPLYATMQKPRKKTISRRLPVEIEPTIPQSFIEKLGKQYMLCCLETGWAKPLQCQPDRYKIPPAVWCIKNPAQCHVDIYQDVIQGSCIDCYFLAALFSRAWGSYPTFPPSSLPATMNFYRLDPVTYQWKTEIINISSGLEYGLDAQSQDMLVGAQASPNNEVWGPVYEKAFGKFLIKCDLPDTSRKPQPSTLQCDDPNDTEPLLRPDLLTFPQYSPLNCLLHLTKLKFDFNWGGTSPNWRKPTAFTTDDLGCTDKPCAQGGTLATTSYDQLKSNLLNPLTYYQDVYENGTQVQVAARKTNYPTVAWTAGSCYYSFNEMIAGQHSYSVLGSVSYDGTDYIVLRNPWGINYISSMPSIAGLISDNVDYIVKAGCPAINLNKDNPSENNKGFFGIKSMEFDKWFAGFGWASIR